MPELTPERRQAVLALSRSAWEVLSSARPSGEPGGDPRVDAAALERLREAGRGVAPGPIPCDPTLPVHMPVVVQAIRAALQAVPPVTTPTPGRHRAMPAGIFRQLSRAVLAASE